MIIGTTPTFTLKVASEDLDFNIVKNIYFTIKLGDIKYTKTGSDITIVNNNTVAVTLTQEETLSFHLKTITEIQLNWTYNDGTRAATKIKTVEITKNLIKEVLE